MYKMSEFITRKTLQDAPLGLRSLMCRLRLVVGKLEFILSRLLVVNIACVTSFQVPELLNEDVVALLWDMEHGPASVDSLGIEGIF